MTSDIHSVLRENHIDDVSTTIGLHTTTCPRCSHDRKEAHQKLKCLSVKVDAEGVCWHCNHCGWSGGLSGGNKFDAIYEYGDSDGQLLWQKLRYRGAKRFAQRKPNGSGWQWKDVRKGQRSVLYRLPEVNAAIKEGRTIVLVEGEKDADNLWVIGIAATCNPDGAAKPGQKPKWSTEHSAQLRGADIIVLGDHDAAGYAHQAATARLSYGVARRVQVLKLADHWPECPEGGDVSDWRKAGHSRKDFDALLAKATDYVSDHAQTNERTSSQRLLQSSDAFVAEYVPPDYTVDGLLLRRRVYALTAPTGWGKTAITLRIAAHKGRGMPLHGREMDKGCVLYFAGENPDDVCMRWIKQCEEMGVAPEEVDVHFMSSTPDLSSDETRRKIDAEIELLGRPIDLVIVDTLVTYFVGDDESDRVQMANLATMFRSYTTLRGGPTVLINCHPVKNYNPDNLVPAGGGTFLNLIDGNLVCLREPGSMVVEVSTQGKFRGPEFAPLSFKLQTGTSDKLKDSKGRLIPTVTAVPVADAERASIDEAARAEQEELLSLMREKPGLSLAAMATELGWLDSNGRPYKTKVRRALRALADLKLIEKRNGVWQLTKAGMQAARPRRSAQGDLPY